MTLPAPRALVNNRRRVHLPALSPHGAPPGEGTLVFAQVAGRTVVHTAHARSPLRLLTPRNHGHAAWAFVASLGGGLVDGDHLRLSVHVREAAAALIGTQAQTKVYRGERGARQTFEARVDAGGLLAGTLAQKRLARGLRLSYPEAVALVATVLLELVRDGRPVAELMDVGRRILGRAQVMDGVPEMIAEVQVEGTFPDGTKLVTVHHPIALMQGDLALALYGSFLPAPDPSRFPDVAPAGPAPGELLVDDGEIEINAGRRRVAVAVTNRGDRPIQVGSHYPFDDTNRALDFDRGLAGGMRLDIPAGTAVRFEPGDEKTVTLVEVARSEAS